MKELVSSTGKTDDGGHFEIFLPTGNAGLFDLKIVPGAGVKAPSIERFNVRPTTALAGFATLDAIRYPALPRPIKFQLPVAGADAAGGRKAALGATVRFTSVLLSSSTEKVQYETQAEVGTAGFAELDLIPGVLEQSRSYDVTVLPLANTLQGTQWDAKISVGPANPSGEGGLLAELDLPARVLITGTVRDADGKPVNKVTVRPQLSAEFTTSAGPAIMEKISGMRLPEVTTNELGFFSVYLDAKLARLDALYDVELIPLGSSVLPRWSRDRVAPSAEVSKVELGDVPLPSASLVSGIVRDELGAPVADAEIRVYMREGSGSSRQRALAKSDASGKIELVLPAP
jgi:hypothetical protein